MIHYLLPFFNISFKEKRLVKNNKLPDHQIVQGKWLLPKGKIFNELQEYFKTDPKVAQEFFSEPENNLLMIELGDYLGKNEQIANEFNEKIAEGDVSKSYILDIIERIKGETKSEIEVNESKNNKAKMAQKTRTKITSLEENINAKGGTQINFYEMKIEKINDDLNAKIEEITKEPPQGLLDDSRSKLIQKNTEKVINMALESKDPNEITWQEKTKEIWQKTLKENPDNPVNIMLYKLNDYYKSIEMRSEKNIIMNQLMAELKQRAKKIEKGGIFLRHDHDEIAIILPIINNEERISVIHKYLSIFSEKITIDTGTYKEVIKSSSVSSAIKTMNTKSVTFPVKFKLNSKNNKKVGE